MYTGAAGDSGAAAAAEREEGVRSSDCEGVAGDPEAALCICSRLERIL